MQTIQTVHQRGGNANHGLKPIIDTGEEREGKAKLNNLPKSFSDDCNHGYSNPSRKQDVCHMNLV